MHAEGVFVSWRGTEPYLSSSYLDSDVAELLDIVATELPFERVRDGNVIAWTLRAEHSGVIDASDRIQLLAGLRTARRVA